MMIRLLHLSWRTVRRLMVLGIILIGVLVAALRLTLPLAEGYRGEIAAGLAELLGHPVRIGALRAHWAGATPQLELRGLLIGEGEGSSLRLGQLDLAIDPIDSLYRGTLSLKDLTVSGARLQITRREDGSIVAANLGDETGDAAPVPLLLATLPARLSLVDSEMVWEDRLRGRSPLHLRDLSLTLRHDGSHYGARAQFLYDEAPVTLAADLHRWDDSPDGWSTDLYLRGEGVPLERLAPLLPEGVRLDGRVQQVELWSLWERGRLVELSGRADARQLVVTEQWAGATLRLDRLAGGFLWTREKGKERIEISDLRMAIDGQESPASDVLVLLQPRESGEMELLAGVDRLQVGDLAYLARLLPSLGGGAREALERIDPHGYLEQVRLQGGLDGGAEGWRASATLRGLTLEPWQGSPRVANLDAELRLEGVRGEAIIDSRAVLVKFPGLFRVPLAAHTLRGDLRWGPSPEGGWRIESDGLEAENPDLHTLTRLRMEIPDDPAASLFLDLQSDFHDGDARSTGRYLPVGIMGGGLVEWLDRAIVGGRVTSGSALVHGPLRDFPFHQTNSGRFEIQFDTEGVTLDYQPGWPQIEGLAAHVRFLDNSLDIWAREGTIFDTRLGETHGWISSLLPTSPFELQGETSGPLADQIRLLRESPLRQDFGPLVSGVSAKGGAHLNLGLAIPLDQGEFRLDGRLHFDKATLARSDLPYPLSNIQGELQFDQRGVRARGIRATLLGDPLTLDLAPQEGRPGATRAHARLQASMDHWQREFPGWGLEHLSGTPELNVRLDIPPLSDGPEAPVGVELDSELRGLAIDLPPPLGKEGDEVRRIHLRTEVGSRPERELQLAYADLFALRLGLARNDDGALQPTSGTLMFGGPMPELPTAGGFEVRGQIRELYLPGWFTLFRGMDGAGGGGLPGPELVDLQIGNLGLEDGGLEELRLAFRRIEGGWSGRIDQERIAGTLRIPADLAATPLVGRFERLAFEFDPERAARNGAPEEGHPDPVGWPALDLQSEHLLINGNDLGVLRIEAVRVADGLEFTRLQLGGEGISLEGAGAWRGAPGEDHTHLEAVLETEDLGALLVRLGYAPHIDAAPTTLVIDGSWSGGPAAVGLDRLRGEVRMEVGKGSFREVDPGLGRVFGLLNFAAIQRRLTLDFSDMFGKGFSFDRIDGLFTLADGQATTDNLHLAGPAADIDVKGRIGLVDQDFDETVTVSANLSSAIPIAGTIAGGPAVGAALLVAQQLVGEQVDAISSAHYSVKGPWSAPEITSLKPAVELDQTRNRPVLPNLP